MNKLIGVLVGIIGIALGLYVGGWLLFVKAILIACSALDAGKLTAVIVGWTVIKCLIASTVGSVIAFLGITIGGFITTIGD